MMASEELLELVDATLPGPMPFKWTRTYSNSYTRDSGLGIAWSHSCNEVLEIDVATVTYTNNRGKVIPFDLPGVHQRSINLAEGLILYRLSQNSFILKEDGQWDKVFSRLNDVLKHCPLIQLRHCAYVPVSSAQGDAEEKGFCINVHYNEQQRISRLQGNWGKSLRVKHNSHGRVQTLILSNDIFKQQKTVAEYDYDQHGDLIAHRNAKGVGEKYAYTNHLLIQRILTTGFNFNFEWDGTDHTARCIHSWGDQGIHECYFDWDKEKKRSKTTDSRGFQCQYEYNDYGQVIEKIDNEGGIHRADYRDGRKQTDVDPEGNTTQHFYDNHHYAGIRDALGHQVTIDYFKGRPTTVTDKDKTVQRREYNACGQLITVIDPYRQRTLYTYSKQGLLTSITDPMKRSISYRWNDSGELTQLTDISGLVKRFRYDAWGQVVTITSLADDKAPGSTTEYRYSATGVVEEVVTANGDTTHYTYNDNDQLIRHSDPQGRTTEYVYDGLSQVVERIDAEGQNLKYEYDTESNLTALVNENGERYQFFYDGNGRLIKEIGFDGRVQHYKYNKAGHLIKHMDAGEVLTEFECDALGQMLGKICKSIKNPDQKREITRYQYDVKGRLRETYNANQYIAFEYSHFDQLKKEHHSDLDASGKNRLKASMVDIGFSHIWPGIRSGIELPDGQSIQYQFDHNNQLSDVFFNGNIVTQIERDVFGRETHRYQGVLDIQSDYDPMGRLCQQASFNRQNKVPGLIQRKYTYDAFGNLNQIIDGNTETRFIYDLVNRLEKTEGDHKESFSVDASSNLISVNGSPVAKSEGNRLTMQGDRIFTYDDRGNLIKESKGKDGQPETEFTYNLQNQLISIKKDGQITHYRYDPLGRRISKQDMDGITKYLWIGDQLVQEQRDTLKKTYIYESEGFRPVAVVQNNAIYHYHLDHLGTPKELSDQEGKVVWKAYYKSYGSLALKEVEEVENNLRFQGQYFDDDSGLHYSRHRYYDPNTGQFIQQDPIGLSGGVNSYQYARNPISWIDPLGFNETIRTSDTDELAMTLAAKIPNFANEQATYILASAYKRSALTAFDGNRVKGIYASTNDFDIEFGYLPKAQAQKINESRAKLGPLMLEQTHFVLGDSASSRSTQHHSVTNIGTINIREDFFKIK